MRPAPIRAEVLRDAEAFSGLADGDLRTLAACLRGVRFEPGEVVFREGDPGATLILVAEGALVATVRGRDGAARRLNRMVAAEVVGEMAFLDPGPRSATVTAETEAVAYELSHDTMEVLRQRAPAVVGAIVTAVIRDVTRRLRSLDARIAVEIDHDEASP